jgi:hypothetical protein
VSSKQSRISWIAHHLAQLFRVYPIKPEFIVFIVLVFGI